MTAQTRSVELLKAVRIEGDAIEPPAEITMPVDMAADLVHRDCARYMCDRAAPVDNTSIEPVPDPSMSGDGVVAA